MIENFKKNNNNNIEIVNYRRKLLFLFFVLSELETHLPKLYQIKVFYEKLQYEKKDVYYINLK